MLKNFKGAWLRRDAKFVARVVLGVLLATNLAALGLVLFPVGGSAEELEMQSRSLQSQVQSRQATLERSRQHAGAVQTGRAEGDRFLNDYFLANRTAFSTLVAELVTAASQAKITAGEHGYAVEPIEGSDDLSMMSITGTYQGTYANLLRFVHEIDRSPRLLIIESLNAAPQQGSDKLTVSLKLDTFVREDGQ